MKFIYDYHGEKIPIWTWDGLDEELKLFHPCDVHNWDDKYLQLDECGNYYIEKSVAKKYPELPNTIMSHIIDLIGKYGNDYDQHLQQVSISKHSNKKHIKR